MNITGLIFIIIGLYIFSELNRKIIGIIIIGVGLHSITYQYKLKSIHYQEQMTNWKTEQSLKLHSYFKKDFGNPWISINQENGFAIWKKTNKQNIYDKIIVKDSLVQYSINDKNYEHSLHLYIQIYIPSNMLNNILNMYKTVSYSKPMYMLHIISDNIKNGNNTLLSILQDIHKNQINNNNQSINDLIKLNKNIYKMYIESKQLY